MPSLIRLTLDQGNGGIIRDLSDEGLSLHAVTPLRVGQEVALRFDLLSPRLRVEAVGCVVWADPAGRAGVEFLDTPVGLQRRLKEWIFTRVLAAARENTRDLLFAGTGTGQEVCQLTFSENPRPAIVLKSEPAAVELEALPAEDPSPESSSSEFRVTWWMVDSLILVAAVLLFSVISLAMTRSVPPWPFAVAFLLAVAGIFAALYWFLFAFWTGCTFGERLVRLEGRSEDSQSQGEERPRFR